MDDLSMCGFPFSFHRSRLTISMFITPNGQVLQAALDATEVKVTGAYDDPNGSHISIEVVSAQFEGKRSVQRQQLVYKAIWEELQGPVHAVDSMVCKTPSES